jgi:hypothetical protein
MRPGLTRSPPSSWLKPGSDRLENRSEIAAAISEFDVYCPAKQKRTVAVTVLEAFLLILTMTTMMAVYEWRHSHLFANDKADQPFGQ